MARIYVENEPYDVPEGQNVLHACLSLGFDIPYFCWHPGMHSVGACRQCAVKQFKDENDRQGQIVMSCMLHATEGTRISIRDPEAAEFRAAVIELLMSNHPHDCPVCDEGGECHLQDMTVMTGHNYRRYRFGKRTHRNQYLGPFIEHEMNRCIACYRCVRFYREYAGGRDLDVFQAHNDVYFGRHADGVLESAFSGNLIEVCPTGVFTDKTLHRHYTRKWDLQTAPSVCVHCGVGCNTIAGERYGTLRRIRNRYNAQVNGYWLCDRGRFGYEFVNDRRRIRTPLVRADKCGTLEPAGREDALRRAATLLGNPDRVIGIGSPRASLEANFALRTLVGAERFYCGLSNRDCTNISGVLEILRGGPARSPSLAEVGHADATFILGEDVAATAPMMALMIRRAALGKEIGVAKKLHIPAWHDAAVREAIQQERGPVFIAAATATGLDDLATRAYRGAPHDLARLGFAVAHAISDDAPAVEGLSGEAAELADTIAAALAEAERPLVVSGTSLSSRTVLWAAANVAWALCARAEKGTGPICAKHPPGRSGKLDLSPFRAGGELALTASECNSIGMGLMGGCGVGAACEALRQGTADTVVVLENDLYRRADAPEVTDLLDAAKHVIVLDHLDNATTERADVVLPAATFAEGDGTLVNSEGRAQRFYQVFIPQGDVQESWRWLRDLMIETGRLPLADEAQAWSALDDVTAAMARQMPVFAEVTEISAPARFRIAGEKIPRQPHRYSGRTAMHADASVHEPKTPDDPDSPLAYSMEGYPGQPPPSLIPRYWAPGWNSVQALNKFQKEVAGPLRGGDPGRRLIEPATDQKASYYRDVPTAFASRAAEGRWLVVPMYHVFGSEELSVLSLGIAELAPSAYVAVHPEDARRLGVEEGDLLRLADGGACLQSTFPVRIMPSLAEGVAALAAGLPETACVDLPDWAQLEKREP